MTNWTEPPSQERWGALVDRLRSSSRVLCIAHVSPDADALGSALAAAIALEATGVAARVSFDEDPFRLPTNLAWLPRQDLVVDPVQAEEFGPDAAVSFDASDLARLGDLGKKAAELPFFAAIDHHRSFTGFSDLAIVDTSAPATAVMALELVDRLGVPLTQDIAECLYAGLTTDTGSFRFAGTTADTHQVAARLHTVGVRHDAIARAVFDTHSLAALKLLGTAIERATLVPEAANGRGLVWSWISRGDRHQLGLPLDAAEPIIDTLRTTAEAEVAVILKEDDDGVWRVSTRSKGAVDVGLVCCELGGGGHRFAAGFSATGPARDVVDTIVETIR